MTKKQPLSFIPTDEEAQEIEKYINIHKCSRTEAIRTVLAQTQITPSVEVIRSTPQEAKKHINDLEKAQKILDMRAEADHKHTVEVQLRELARQKTFTKAVDKIDGGSGDGHHETSYTIPKTERPPEALKADAYGFYGDWDWTPEQIAAMEKQIPCRGVEEVDWESWN